MLEGLLEYGRHLPVFALALSWLTPASWAGLRRARRSFRRFLRDEKLCLWATAFTVPDGSLYEVINAVSRSEQQHGQAEGGLWRTTSRSGSFEVSLCEAAFVALLRGQPIDKVQPTTGMTPLMLAAEDCQHQLCHLLLAWRADPDRASIGGSTPLSMALDASCGRCLTSARPDSCHCPRPALALALLPKTNTGLPAAFAAAVRMSLQDFQYLTVVEAFVTERGLPVDTEIEGPDARCGTALSVALERRIRPVEAPLAHRFRTVAKLLELRADPSRPGPYTSWCGGKPVSGLLPFAVANGCDLTTLELLTGQA